MKKLFFAAILMVASFNVTINAMPEGEHVVIEMPKKSAPKSSLKTPPSAENGDKKTGIYTKFGEKEYEIWLNKNNKAFIWVPKADASGNYRKWLGAEMTNKVLAAIGK